MLKPEEYAAYDGLGLKALLDAGEVSAAELRETALQAIETLNPTLNFLVSTSTEEADRAIAHWDPTLPFAGVPVLVKEGAGMAGQPVSMGCRLGKGLLCDEDSELIRRLKKTGAVILGSTNSPEIGNSATTESVFHGPARNPWNIHHSTGGSSGGSSAAVAAGVVPIAQSSDGGGSIRIPAHCCGVFGFVPTRGRTAVGPQNNGRPYGLTRSHVITRSVRDSAAMLDYLQGAEPGALYHVTPPKSSYLQEVGADPGRLRIAFSTDSPSGTPVHPDCVSGVLNAVRLCEALGHDVERAAPVFDWQEFYTAFGDYWAFNTTHRIRQLEQLTGRQAGPDTLETTTLRLLEHSRALTGERLANSWDLLHNINRAHGEFMLDRDIFLTPTCLAPAPELGVLNSNEEGITLEQWFDKCLTEFAAFTAQFNANGHPAMSVPLHHSAAGLPVGVQCVGRYGDEATLLRLAAQFEQASPWTKRHPPTSLY